MICWEAITFQQAKSPTPQAMYSILQNKCIRLPKDDCVDSDGKPLEPKSSLLDMAEKCCSFLPAKRPTFAGLRNPMTNFLNQCDDAPRRPTARAISTGTSGEELEQLALTLGKKITDLVRKEVLKLLSTS